MGSKPTSVKPTIGFTASEAGYQYFLEWQRDYWFCIEIAGGEPLSLNPASVQDVQVALDQVDGLLLTGGGDIHPRFYNQPIDGTAADSIRLDRDQMELDLITSALDRGIPIFGICRGIQVLNVALGGSLTQHVDNHTGATNSFIAPRPHAVSIRPRSLLDRTLGCGISVEVNSYHHQAVCSDDLAPALLATGIAADGLIEAVEHPVHPWCLAVQWHPERLYELGAEQRNLFLTFVSAARDYRVNKTQERAVQIY